MDNGAGQMLTGADGAQLRSSEMENGDDGGLTGRMSGRAKPKKDYSTIHRVGSTDLTKQIS